METAVSFKNVSKDYPVYHHITSGIKSFLFNFPKAIREMRANKFNALQDISFEIKKGEVVGFIGRNGAGKSTSLGLIAQVLAPNSGQVTVNQRVSPLLELGGGFHPDLTGRENIKLNGVLLGLSIQEIASKQNAIIDFSELGQFIDQPIRTYSSGMLSRLGFSVVAHLDPELLLIDEVLAVGDASFQVKCYKKIEEFRDSGVTIIIVSHNHKQIERLCNKVIWIDNHRIKHIGHPKDVIPRYLEFFNISDDTNEDIVLKEK